MSNAGALPKYLQISEMLIREIAAGHLAPGSRLPPEREMAADLGIAVGTLRKALDALTDQGMLDRVQGSGNYVRQGPADGAVYAFFRLEKRGGAGLPTAQVISVDRLEKDASLPSFGRAGFAHRIRRLRFLDDIPAAVEEIWLDGSYAETVSAKDLSDSLYLFYRNALNLVIGSVVDSIGVGDVPRWAPEAFGVPAGRPAGLVERFSTATDGTVAEFSRVWFDPAQVRYVSRLGKG